MADDINEAHLATLKGKTLRTKAEVTGDFTKEYFPTAPDLRYKIGAQIMMLNNDSAKQWVNGSLGIIESLGKEDDGTAFLRVRLQGQTGTVKVYAHSWEVYRFGVADDAITSEPVGTFVQYPFRLAWAITIHKSQGKTFDHVTIDIGNGTFAAGQTYVALSRCTSLQGITLKRPISKNHIRTDNRIIGFMERVPTSLPAIDADKITLIETAIRNKTSLDIIYLKGDDSQTSRTVTPVSLGKETHKGQNFTGMKAFCRMAQQDRIFSLDRILTLSPRKS